MCHRPSGPPSLCQILRKSINIWYPNRPKTFKNYAYPTFQLHLLEVLDNWQRWKSYRWARTEKLNRIDPKFSPNNQLKNLTWFDLPSTWLRPKSCLNGPRSLNEYHYWILWVKWPIQHVSHLPRPTGDLWWPDLTLTLTFVKHLKYGTSSY